MKIYEIKNLQKELRKTNNIIKDIKELIEDHNGPAWSKNNLIRKHNKYVRVSKAIRESILNGLAENAEKYEVMEWTGTDSSEVTK